MARIGGRGPLLCAALIGAIGCWNRTPLEDFVPAPAANGGAGASAAGSGGPSGGGTSGGGLAGSGALSPELFAPAEPGCGSIELATGGGKVAWTDRDHGRVWITTPGGKLRTRISDAERSPSLIAVDNDGAVVWSSLDGIRRAKPGGLPVTIVSTSAPEIRGLALSPNGRHIYYSAGASILRATADGNELVEIAHHEHRGIPTAIALDVNRLVYVSDPTGEVYAVTVVENVVASCGIYNPMTEEISGFNCVLIGNQGSLFSRQILARPGQAIWASGASLSLGDTARVSHESITSVSSSITAVAGTGPMVYFLASTLPSAADYGTVYEVPAALHQKAVPIATEQDQPGSIAADGARVYWSTGACAIMSLSI